MKRWKKIWKQYGDLIRWAAVMFVYAVGMLVGAAQWALVIIAALATVDYAIKEWSPKSRLPVDDGVSLYILCARCGARGAWRPSIVPSIPSRLCPTCKAAR